MSMELTERINSFVQRHQLISPQSTVVLGLSGGPDSVFLFHYLLTLKTSIPFDLIVAHLNHGWRATADHDEQFCRELAEQFGVPFVGEHARKFIDEVSWTGSREEQGRLMRRLFFANLIESYPNTRIALAHHQDDQYETFLIRLLRGAGLQGLRGMVPTSDQYIRPLLCVRKEEMLEYLRAHNLSFVIDCTNADVVHLRNRIRHQVIPALRACDHRFCSSFQQTMHNLSEADDFCTELAEQTFRKLITAQDKETWINFPELLKLHPFMQKQVIMRWLCATKVPFVPSQGLFHEILRFLQQPQGGKHQLHHRWFLKKQQHRASIQHV
jgi:tRNA(Ile)-lysidine synthase